MPLPKDKIVNIVDETTESRGVSVEQVGLQGALIVKDVGTPSLPTGASTEAKQDTQIGQLTSIASDTGSISAAMTGVATATKQDDQYNAQVNTNTKLDTLLSVDFANATNQSTSNTLLGGIAGLVPTAYDYISLSYTGSNLTGVVFKTGGSGGTTVATLTLAYSGSTLTSVTKT